jgi:hypothetical protein
MAGWVACDEAECGAARQECQHLLQFVDVAHADVTQIQTAATTSKLTEQIQALLVPITLFDGTVPRFYLHAGLLLAAGWSHLLHLQEAWKAVCWEPSHGIPDC